MVIPAEAASAGVQIPPSCFSSISIWNGCLETSWRNNAELQSSLRDTQAAPQPRVHHRDQNSVATSCGGSGSTTPTSAVRRGDQEPGLARCQYPIWVCTQSRTLIPMNPSKSPIHNSPLPPRSPPL